MTPIICVARQKPGGRFLRGLVGLERCQQPSALLLRGRSSSLDTPLPWSHLRSPEEGWRVPLGEAGDGACCPLLLGWKVRSWAAADDSSVTNSRASPGIKETPEQPAARDGSSHSDILVSSSGAGIATLAVVKVRYQQTVLGLYRRLGWIPTWEHPNSEKRSGFLHSSLNPQAARYDARAQVGT